MKYLKLVLLGILLINSLSIFAQTDEPCATCGTLPLSGGADQQLGGTYTVSVTLQDNMDTKFLSELQIIMLNNLKDEANYKYLNKTSPDYISDEFLQYSTEVFAGEAAKRAQKEYEKDNGKGTIIPADKFNSLVLAQARKLERGAVTKQENKCFEYDCVEPGCGERKRNADLILARIEEMEAAKDADLLNELRKVDAKIFQNGNKKADNTALEAQKAEIEKKLRYLFGLGDKGSLLNANFSVAIGDLKELLINNDPADGKAYGLPLEKTIGSDNGTYPVYYNKEIVQLANPRNDYFKLDFTTTETEKVKVNIDNKPKQFNVQSIELDPNEVKMHSDNKFSLDQTKFAEKVQIPDANKLNAVYCESSASDLRPTVDAQGKTIPQGEFDYLNFELSHNRNNECKNTVINHFKLTEDKIVLEPADGLSEQAILDKQAAFYGDKKNEGKVQVFQKFKGAHGDGTSGAKSYYCASEAYVKKNSLLCPAEAIKSGYVKKEELKKSWMDKYNYTSETFDTIISKQYPPFFQDFLNAKKKQDPNYQFKPSDLTPEELSQLDAIYDSARYVKMKVFHSPELVEPEKEITYHQKICSDALAISFSSKSKSTGQTGNKTFGYQSSRVRGDGLYGNMSDWGSVGCSF